MVLDCEPSIAMPLPEKCIFGNVVCDLDLEMSTVSSHKRFVRYRANKLLVHDHKHTDGELENRMPPAPF